MAKHVNAASAAKELAAVLAGEIDAMVALLEALVKIESHASQPQGVATVALLLEQRLADAGFTTARVPGPRVPAEDAWLAELMLPGADYNATADVLIARRPGAGRGRTLLLGDLDTSYAPGSLARFPFRVEGPRAYGPGVADMKGGLVVLAFALRALEETGLATPESTTVVLSPDEQAGSLRSHAVIAEEAASADWCLCMECARDGGNLMGSRAHIGVARLDVYGREAHAGSAHASGVSAVEAIARKISAIHELTDPARGVYVTVGEVHGGRRRSVVPGHAYCTIDVRTPDATVWAETERALGRIAETPHLPGTTAELRIRAHRPGIRWTKHTDRLIAVARRAGAALDLSFGVLRSAAAGSSSFAGALGVPTLDGMGPSGGDLMTDHEYIEVPSLRERALLLALTLHLLASGEGTGEDHA